MVSRVLGLVRENMNAHQFGASAAMDAFIVAFRLPNMFRRVFAEGAFSQAFVPVLADYQTTRGQTAAREFLADIAGWLSLALIIFTAAGVVAAPVVVYLSASGFHGSQDKFELAVQLTRITFPYILLISLSSLAGSVLNTWNRFTIPAFTPALLNVSMIACGYLLAPQLEEPIFALAISVALGGILQLGFQLPYLRQIGMLARPRLRVHDEGVWRVLKKMGPAIFGVSVSQISLLLNTNFASHLPNGSISWMNYADRLMELPTGVLGVALGTVLLPSLAKHRAAGADEAYSATLDWGLRLCVLLALPAAVALGVIAQPLVATLFLTTRFTGFDVVMTQRALIAYAVGLIGIIAVKVLAPAYYARHDVRTPVKIAVVALAATQGLNLLLIQPLAHAGLALAISLGACLNAGLLLLGLRRKRIYAPRPGWWALLGKTALAVAVMTVVLTAGQYVLGDWLQMRGWERWLKLAALVAGGAVSYFAVLALLGFRLRDVSRHA